MFTLFHLIPNATLEFNISFIFLKYSVLECVEYGDGTFENKPLRLLCVWVYDDQYFTDNRNILRTVLVI